MHSATLKNHLLTEIQLISDPMLLVQLYDMLQIARSHTLGSESLRVSPAMQFAGSLSDADADEMQQIISLEFNSIEGDWE
jgi:hypothetical protein